jgi:3-hydroxybutyrate dehydrogenase
MLELAWGRIVNIGSVQGLVSSPHQAAYVAAEHGLVGLTKTIALEAAAMSCDVTARAVAPTPLVGAQIDARAAQCGRTAEAVVADLVLGRNAVKRSIEDEHVAKLVTSVCGPGAWTTTAAAIPMDASWPAN